MSISKINKKYYLLSSLLIFLIYLYAGAGPYADDYYLILSNEFQSWTLSDYLIFFKNKYLSIPLYLYVTIQCILFENNIIFYEFCRVLILIICILLTYSFLKDYVSKPKSFLISLFFILYPIHGSMNYFLTTQSFFLMLSLILYSHKSINRRCYIRGFFTGFIGAFFWYYSPPWGWGLSTIFLIKKEYKKFICFIAPHFLYILYYVIMKQLIVVDNFRINVVLNPLKLLKSYILQIGTFIDISIGPSFILKIYYSIISLSIFSFFVGSILIYLFYKFVDIKKEPINKALLCGLLAIIPISFFIFSMTGHFPQIAFNLGNRVTIFSSFALTFCIVMFLMKNKKIATFIFAIFIFSVLGLSDHWKSWDKNQTKVINNIKNNKELNSLSLDETLYVSGNQYSRLGDIAHIEFFYADFIVSNIFKILEKPYKTLPLNQLFYYKDGYIIDLKYNKKKRVVDHINVYDSEKDKVLKIPANKINNYIDSLPQYNRHWIQLLDEKNWIRKTTLYLMPRLNYIL